MSKFIHFQLFLLNNTYVTFISKLRITEMKYEYVGLNNLTVAFNILVLPYQPLLCLTVNGLLNKTVNSLLEI